MTTRELSKATGLSLRQLQWLDEQGIIQRPRLEKRLIGRTSRIWSREACVQASIYGELKSRGGVGPTAVRLAMRVLARYRLGHSGSPLYAIVLRSGRVIFPVDLSREVCEIEGTFVVVNLDRHVRKFRQVFE